MTTITSSNIRIRILEDIPYLDKTNLAQDISAGTQSVQVFNLLSLPSQTFFAFIGNGNGDNDEVVEFSGGSATSNTFEGTLRFDHKKYEVVQVSSVYKVRLYECSTSNGTFVVVTNGEVNLTTQNPDGTTFFDVDLDTEKYYKINYIEKNADDTDVEIWDIDTIKPFQIEGGDRKDVYATIQEVIDEAGQQYDNYDSKTIWGYIEAAKNRIDTALQGVGVAVPMTNPPAQIKYLTRLLAGIYLRNANGEDTDKQIEYAESLLDKIKDGDIVIPGTSAQKTVSYHFRDYEDRLADLDKKY